MKNEMFTKQSLRRLIIPLIFEQLLAVTVGMFDVMMVSSVILVMIDLPIK